jgi:hypothetical protein
MLYQAALAGWHDFFILAGTASATLVGLLFVGLSLHLRIVVSTSEVRSLARVTLANFGDHHRCSARCLAAQHLGPLGHGRRCDGVIGSSRSTNTGI